MLPSLPDPACMCAVRLDSAAEIFCVDRRNCHYGISVIRIFHCCAVFLLSDLELYSVMLQMFCVCFVTSIRTLH
jgi:hypothetical protein